MSHIKNGIEYTHEDGNGILWRFEGGRPISEIADDIIQQQSDNNNGQTPAKLKLVKADEKA